MERNKESSILLAKYEKEIKCTECKSGYYRQTDGDYWSASWYRCDKCGAAYHKEKNVIVE